MISNDAIKLLKEKQYFQEGETSWSDISLRVSSAIAEAEITEEAKTQTKDQIYTALNSTDFIFSTPVLLNANKENPSQLSSCFVLETKDNIDDICKTDADLAKIFQKNGGAGLDLSVLRPVKSVVNSSKGYAGGVVTFMEKYDATADMMTKYNPSRKGAIKCNLQVWHPQIQEFIHSKDNLNKLNRMNISVSLTDKFMDAVDNDKIWELKFPDYSIRKDIYNNEWDGDIEKWERKEYPVKVYQTIKAKTLMREISEAAWRTGEPI